MKRIPKEAICEDLFKRLEEIYSQSPKKFIKFVEQYFQGIHKDYPLGMQVSIFFEEYFHSDFSIFCWSESSNRRVIKYWNDTYADRISIIIRKQHRNKEIKKIIKKDLNSWQSF